MVNTMARKWWGGDAGFWKPELGDTSGVGVGDQRRQPSRCTHLAWLNFQVTN